MSVVVASPAAGGRSAPRGSWHAAHAGHLAAAANRASPRALTPSGLWAVALGPPGAHWRVQKQHVGEGRPAAGGRQQGRGAMRSVTTCGTCGGVSALRKIRGRRSWQRPAWAACRPHRGTPPPANVAGHAQVGDVALGGAVVRLEHKGARALEHAGAKGGAPGGPAAHQRRRWRGISVEHLHPAAAAACASGSTQCSPGALQGGAYACKLRAAHPPSQTMSGACPGSGTSA